MLRTVTMMWSAICNVWEESVHRDFGVMISAKRSVVHGFSCIEHADGRSKSAFVCGML
ncbi:MAG: hypothetical protein HFH12_05625 [Dorea sp.]|nr:hypothetical protein [Dorea sp.]